jgi:hypothetical protein
MRIQKFVGVVGVAVAVSILLARSSTGIRNSTGTDSIIQSIQYSTRKRKAESAEFEFECANGERPKIVFCTDTCGTVYT